MVNRARYVLLWTALAAAALAPAPAHAADVKTYSGDVCVAAIPAGNQTTAGINDLQYDAATGGISNRSSTQSASIVCSLIRDNTTSATGFQSASIRFVNNGGSMRCTMYSVDNDSTSSMASPQTTTVDDWDVMTYGSLPAGSGWGLTVECVLPKANIASNEDYAEVRIIRVAEP